MCASSGQRIRSDDVSTPSWLELTDPSMSHAAAQATAIGKANRENGGRAACTAGMLLRWNGQKSGGGQLVLSYNVYVDGLWN